MNGERELISIVVPVYNAGEFIENTIRMVEAQTYENWELLLVDDCSSDNSRQVIRRYLAGRTEGAALPQAEPEQSREEKSRVIRLIEKEKNQGAAMARNTGIDEARGRYLAFLDADDVWMPQKLEKELAFMKEKGAAFVFTAYEFGDEEARGTGRVVHAPERLTYRQALSRTVIFTTTVLFDTEKLCAGAGRELLHMPAVGSEDTALWWKILRSGFDAYGLDEVLAIYRRPAGSLSSNKLKAIKRIWYLYRRQERLSLFCSAYNFVFWAFRATLRRI